MYVLVLDAQGRLKADDRRIKQADQPVSPHMLGAASSEPAAVPSLGHESLFRLWETSSVCYVKPRVPDPLQ